VTKPGKYENTVPGYSTVLYQCRYLYCTVQYCTRFDVREKEDKKKSKKNEKKTKKEKLPAPSSQD
jgi:hypothetical protein